MKPGYFKLDHKTMDSLVNYLTSKPYYEVAQLVNQVMSCQFLPDAPVATPKPVEDKLKVVNETEVLNG